MASTKSTKTLQRLLPYMFILLLSLVIFPPIMSVASQRYSDFGSHIDIAEALPHKVKHVSYVLYHAIYLLLRNLVPTINSTDIALWAAMVFILPLPMIIFSLLSRYAAGPISVFAILLLSVGLTIASPITFWSHKMMIGYLNPIVYHNPTMIALRLFVVPVSLLALRIFRNSSYRNANHQLYTILLCASMLLISTIAKPSYTFVLLPGCCAFAAWRVFRGNRVDWMLLIFGFCIPGCLILGLQYLISYINYADGSTISFGIFVFTRYWIPDWRVPIQLLLSLAFPLAVYMLFSEARKNLYINMSWTVFVVSALATYCLYETGTRISHGNFLWNSYVAVFVLMFASLLFLVQQYKRSRLAWLNECQIMPSRLSLKFTIAGVLFGFHVLFGIAYYIRFLTGFGSIT